PRGLLPRPRPDGGRGAARAAAVVLAVPAGHRAVQPARGAGRRAGGRPGGDRAGAVGTALVDVDERAPGGRRLGPPGAGGRRPARVGAAAVAAAGAAVGGGRHVVHLAPGGDG